MTYSKLGNIKGPQGRRGLNMTGNTTPPPPAVDDSVLEGDLWLDSTTGDVYRATDPWAKDGSWRTWNTVLWKATDNVLMVQPAEGDTGTIGREPWGDDGWDNSSNNPSMASITSVRSKEKIAMNANSEGLFEGYTSLTDLSALSGWNTSGVTSMNNMFSDCSALTDISALSGWDVSGVTSMDLMFYNCSSLTDLSALAGWDVSGKTSLYNMFSGCTSLTDVSPLSNWNVSNVTSMYGLFSTCPLERIGIPSLAHGGRNFVSNLKTASVVTNMDTTMLTNTTTHETMSANQIIADMDSNPSKYTTGTVWTISRA